MGIKYLKDLQRLCDDKAEETTSLEFKSCSELIIGSTIWEKKIKRNRTRDDVLNELPQHAFLVHLGFISQKLC